MTWTVQASGHQDQDHSERTERAVAELFEEFLRQAKAGGHHPFSGTFTGNFHEQTWSEEEIS